MAQLANSLARSGATRVALACQRTELTDTASRLLFTHAPARSLAMSDSAAGLLVSAFKNVQGCLAAGLLVSAFKAAFNYICLSALDG
eukprot:1329376-Amphidinium_carterae.1